MTILDELADLGYAELAMLGQGGFGTVYAGIETAFGRRVAIKVIQARFDDDTDRRFDRERRAIAQLPPHPHIVNVHAIARTPSGMPFFVMELVDGGSLGSRVGHLSWQEAFGTGIQLAGALETAHRAGVVHRDVKPENVLLGSYGDAKLTDFGIATLTSGGMTTTAAVTATISHAAPEILSGGPAGPACDVYSLASTIHTLIAGVAPFAPGPDGMPELIARISTQAPPSLTDHGVPAGAAEVILHALAKDPSDRPASAEAFGLALTEALQAAGHTAPAMAIAAVRGNAEFAGAPTAAAAHTDAVTGATVAGRRGAFAPPAPAETRQPRRRVGLLAAVAAGLLVLAGVGVAIAQPWSGDSKPATAAPRPSATSTSPTAKASTPGAKVSARATLPTTAKPAQGTGSTDPGTTPVQQPVTQRTATTTNRAPTLSAVSAQRSDELAAVSLHLHGADSDNGDRLMYTISGKLPAGLTLNANTGVISGTIRASAVQLTQKYTAIKSAAFSLTARVSDGSKSATRTFIWTVRDTALVMPNYYNAYGCGSSCSPASATDSGKPDVSWIGPFSTTCTDTKPSGISDRDKIVSQSVAAGTSIKWGTRVTYQYYPCT